MLDHLLLLVGQDLSWEGGTFLRGGTSYIYGKNFLQNVLPHSSKTALWWHPRSVVFAQSISSLLDDSLSSVPSISQAILGAVDLCHLSATSFKNVGFQVAQVVELLVRPAVGQELFGEPTNIGNHI